MVMYVHAYVQKANNTELNIQYYQYTKGIRMTSKGVYIQFTQL